MKIDSISKVIFGKEYADELDQKILNNKILWLFIMILVVWNSVQTIAFMNVKENNRVVAQFPAVNYVDGEQIVGENYANGNHFLAWGMYHIINLAKFDRENIEEKLNSISNSMTQDGYLKKKASIEKFIQDVKKNKVTSNFKIYNDEWKTKVESSKNNYGAEVTTVTAVGDIFRSYGAYKDNRDKCEYTVSFFRKGGMTYVEDFSTTCY